MPFSIAGATRWSWIPITSVAWSEAYFHAKWHLDPSNRFAAIAYTNVTDRHVRQLTVQYHTANRFWATVCKTVRPVLFPSSSGWLSVTLVYCGQTFGRIKMKLSMEDRPWLHCVRWGPSSPAPLPLPRIFGLCICCG